MPRPGLLAGARALRSGRRSLSFAPAAVALPRVPPMQLTPVVEAAINVRTPVPGPETQKAIAHMGRISDIKSYNLVPDLEKSKGNYMVDADGNSLLDCFGAIGSMALGYNHPALAEASRTPAWTSALLQRPAIGVLPPVGHAELVERTLGRIMPAGMQQVQTMMCGSCANENAFKAATIQFQHRRREGRPLTDAELQGALLNQTPGCADVSILSFTKAFHGRTLGCLATTHSKASFKADVPTLDWPTAPFPDLRYPLAAHEAANAAETARCLAEVDTLLTIWAERRPVAAVVVEPIQAEGGDRHAPAAFFRGLRALTRKHGAALIIDEVQTGALASGSFWMHEQWAFGEDPPDMVTFAKKCQAAGYFYSEAFAPREGFQIFNTWMGDPLRLLQLETVLDVIEHDHLQATVRAAGTVLRGGLADLAAEFPDTISSPRGVGTLTAFDLPSGPARDAFAAAIRNNGVLLNGCGERSFRFRPSLIFTPTHAAEALDGILATLRQRDYAAL